MAPPFRVLKLALLVSLGLSAASADELGSRGYGNHGEIVRDVVIIGAGSSGTYAAVGLKDMGKSVVVVEQRDRIGGHTDPFVDPVTKQPHNLGVAIFESLNVTKEYFDRLGVKYKKAFINTDNGVKLYADFERGKLIPDYKPPNMTRAMINYAQQALRYPELTKGFVFSDPVPKDLLLPFGKFVEKYDIGDAMEVIYTFCQGFGNLLERLTVYVLKTFDLSVLNDLQNGFVLPVSNNNYEPYDKAFKIIKSDVLLKSRVESVERKRDYVRVVVKTPHGRRKIRAKKLLISIPPTLKNLRHFDLDAKEKSLFGQFNTNGYYTSLIHVPGLPKFDSMTNYNPDTPYHLPDLPDIYWVTPSVMPDVYDVKYGSPRPLRDRDVQADIIKKMKAFQAPGSEEPRFVEWSNHSPFGLTVTARAIASGFYNKVYSLQGKRSTYYTGAAFHAHNSALLWQYTKELLPKLAK